MKYLMLILSSGLFINCASKPKPMKGLATVPQSVVVNVNSCQHAPPIKEEVKAKKPKINPFIEAAKAFELNKGSK